MKIFHIVDKKNWYEIKKESKEYSPDSLNHEGFIHCCKIDQILMVADTFFKGKHGLVLLVINQMRVDPKVVHEAPFETPTSKYRFPHIYGALNLSAVENEFEFHPKDDGTFEIPNELFEGN